MRILGAYLLAVLGGKENPGAADINKILDSVGIKADAEELKLVLNHLEGKNIDQLIAEGSKKMSVVSGGAAVAAGGSAAPAAGGKKKEEEKKTAEKPKKEEKPKEESGGDIGFSLFE